MLKQGGCVLGGVGGWVAGIITDGGEELGLPALGNREPLEDAEQRRNTVKGESRKAHPASAQAREW